MQKHRHNLSFVLFCLFMLPIAHAQNDVPIHPVDGEYIKEWLVLGPFFRDDLEKDFLVDVGGEANIEPNEGDTVATAKGKTLTWKRYQTQGSLIALWHVVGHYEHATAYAFCTLRSEAEGKVQILLGSDDGASVWINGEQVHHNPVDRPLIPDEDMFEADFLAGANRCLVKVSQDIKDWGFAMRAFPHNQPVLVTPKFFLSSDHLKDGTWLPDGLWKYHRGDNAEWASPEFDDSEWETTSTRLNPNNLPKSGWNGIGWFRLHLVVDSTLWNRPLALNVSQWGASEIYLDGRLVAQFGKVGSLKRDEEGYLATNTDFLPPPKAIVFGKTNHVIAVRFSNFYPQYPQLWQGFRIVLRDLNSAIALSVSQKRVITNIQMVLTIVPVVFAILHLLLFFFYPRAKENLYYTLFTLTFGALWFTFLQTGFSLVTDSRQALLFFKLNYALVPIAFIAGLRFSYALFYPRLPKQFWIFLLIGAGIGMWKWGHPFSQWYVHWFIMITLLEMLRVVVVAIRRKKDGAWIIGVGFIFFTVAFLWVFINFILDMLAILPLNWNIFFALALSGFFVLLLSMSVFLSRNFARTNKNLEAQLIQVKDLSEKTIRQERERAQLEAENTRKTQELEEARQLQLSMLPKCIDEIPGLDICFHMQTATEVGGDYYDYHLADDGTLTIAIGDATGHGMKAGTMVSVIKSLFIAEASQTDILSFFKKCTQTIKQMRLGNLYMAMMLIKIKDHKMTASSAGIPPIYIYRSETKSVEEIVIKGMPLGGPASFPYKQRETNLAPGDTVLLMSDGFAELFNDKDEMLDYPRVKEIFKEAAERSADEIVAHLFKAGERWSNGRPQDDDITFVVLKVKHNTDLL